MKYKIVETKAGGKVLIDESAEIKEGIDGFGCCLDGEVFKILKNPLKYKTNHPITATINFSISLDVPMVIVEDEVEKLACRKYGTDIYAIESIEAFKEGYTAAQQKGGYSESDLRKAFREGVAYSVGSSTYFQQKPLNENDYIQSLNQKELVMEEYVAEMPNIHHKLYRIKTNRVDGQLTAYIKQ